MGEEGEIIYLSLHCHHQNDSCIKMGIVESRFNASLIVRDKDTRQCPQTTIFLKRKESRSGIEPRSFCLMAKRLTARSNQLTQSCLSMQYFYTHPIPVHGHNNDDGNVSSLYDYDDDVIL